MNGAITIMYIKDIKKINKVSVQSVLTKRWTNIPLLCDTGLILFRSCDLKMEIKNTSILGKVLGLLSFYTLLYRCDENKVAYS